MYNFIKGTWNDGQQKLLTNRGQVAKMKYDRQRGILGWNWSEESQV